MVAGASVASAAAADRGRARNPVPKALTNVATASPPVRATTATASGMITATAAVDDGRL